MSKRKSETPPYRPTKKGPVVEKFVPLGDYQNRGIERIVRSETSPYGLTIDIPRWSKGEINRYEECQVRGVILGFPQGMGKTVTVIQGCRLSPVNAFFGTFTLIVCPKTVISHWKKEFERFSEFPVYVWSDKLPGVKNFSPNTIIITTYGMLQRATSQHFFLTHRWYRVVMDEIQKLKSPGTHTRRVANQLSTFSKIGLSGTIAMNNPHEWLSVLSFFIQHDSVDFRQLATNFNSPFQTYNLMGLMVSDAIREVIYVSPTPAEIETYYGRLPKKTVEFNWLSFSPLVWKIYNDIFTTVFNRFNIVGPQKIKKQNAGLALNWVTFFKQFCNVPLSTLQTYIYTPPLEPPIIDEANNNTWNIKKVVTARLEALGVVRDSTLLISDLPSPKITFIVDRSSQILQTSITRKIVIFSNYLASFDLIYRALRIRGHTNIDLRLVGSMDDAKRERAIKEFTENPLARLIMVSTSCGGLGTNLQAGTDVFYMDPWWNDKTRKQAEDRVYRFGQTQPVNIYILNIMGTLEENFYTLHKRKDTSIEAMEKITAHRNLRIDSLKLMFDGMVCQDKFPWDFDPSNGWVLLQYTRNPKLLHSLKWLIANLQGQKLAKNLVQDVMSRVVRKMAGLPSDTPINWNLPPSRVVAELAE